MVLARAQRLAEHGKDVVILLDSITRLARAYNLVVPASGKTLSGGFDPGALAQAKEVLRGSAETWKRAAASRYWRQHLWKQEAVWTTLSLRNSRGQVTWSFIWIRKLSEKSIFPAIDLNKSGTRREDLLMNQEELEAIWHMRRALGNRDNQEVTEMILDNLAHTRDNKTFIEVIKKIRSRRIT